MSDEALVDRIYGRYSKASKERLRAMAAACRKIDARGIEGDIVECGVWRGGHIIIARWISPSRSCWLYDTFTGMPRPSGRDVKIGDKGRTALETWNAKTKDGRRWAQASKREVLTNLVHESAWDRKRCHIIVGEVEQTLRCLINLPEKIALLRLDTDWYASTKVELEVLYPRLAKGGVLIVDDYGHWRGAREAVVEYFAAHRIDLSRLQRIDYTAVQMVK